MKLVRCVSERKTNPSQIIVGNQYWIDENSIYKDSDNDEFVQVYLDESKQYPIGNMLISHFKNEN